MLALCGLGLAAFLIWQASLLGSYIATERQPPAWDQSVHLEIAWDYWRAIGHGRWSQLLFLPPKPGMPPFPPLYHLGLVWIYGHAQPASMALWMNWLYLAVLCLAVFGIGCDYIGAEKALAASILFACAPLVQSLAHQQLVDLELAALAAAAYWALLKSDGFERAGPSVGFGALYGAGMLCKWSFFSYMIPAYWLGWGALGRPSSRKNALAAAAVACAACGPWYAAHLSELPLRLVQASSDFAVPVWHGAAILDYFLKMPDDLGVVLWGLGTVGLLLRHYRQYQEYDWLLPAWVLSSYVFWSIVPNRQMRFLLPGLPGLAVLACCAAPRSVTWAAVAFQVLVAANYTKAWIAPRSVELFGYRAALFPVDPPVSEDWKISDILRTADRMRSPDRPFSNLTLVANAPYFNGPTFAWFQKYLELPGVEVRGVNRRLCEFSEFVLLKTGSLGPPGAIGGLPEASRIISSKGGWFDRSYVTAASWPLPDGSSAVLYRQRKWKAPPFPVRPVFFQYYADDPLTAEGLRVEFGPWDAAKSDYRDIRVRADLVELRGFKARKVRLRFTDALLVPAGEHPLKAPWEDVRFLKAGSFEIESLEATGEDFGKFLRDRAPGLEVRRLELDSGRVALDAAWKFVPLHARASVRLVAGRRIEIRLLSARVGPVPIPLFLLGRRRIFSVSLDPNPETPFRIELPGLRLQGGRLAVGASGT